MSAYDFTDLTEAQQRVLTLQGWAPGQGKQPRPGTVRKLLDRGLVVARPVQVMGITVTAYDVPTPIHIAWCEHCAATTH